MKRYRRTAKDKLHTLLFGKDIRVTDGDIFSEVYDGDFSSYFPKEEYIKEQVPTKEPVFDFREFQGESYTQKLNNAILRCSESGGGTVVVKDGSYTVNTVFLKDNVTLFIDKSASLVASHDTKAYEKEAIIYADCAKNIEITGGGKICGEGNFFGLKPVEKPLFTAPDYIDIIEIRQEYRKRIRFAHMSKYGSISNLNNCENVSIHNIIFENSASWTLHIQNCSNVTVKNFMINNNRHIANADGIDINSTSDFTAEHCFISTADDGICLKNAVYTGSKGEMKNIHFSDCEVISCTNAFKIGTETTYDIHNVTVENCRFFMNDIYPQSVSGISLEAVDGSKVYDIKIKNIQMDRVSCPLFIRLGNRNRAAEVDENTARATELAVDETKEINLTPENTFNFKSELSNIEVENITAKDIEEPIIISGFKDKNGTKRVKNVLLKDFNMQYRNAREVIDRRLFIPEYAKEYPECNRFRNLPSYKLFLRHAENIKLENITCIPAPNTWKKEEYRKDVK